MSMPKGEIQTERVVRHALGAGKHVFVPYIYKPVPQTAGSPASVMDMLQLASEADYATLEPDKWGIPSIPKESITERANCFGGKGLTDAKAPTDDAIGLDVILMPSMAFDHEMNRLGHGKGYYDNFLTRYTSKGNKEGHARKKPFLGMSFPIWFARYAELLID